MSFAQSIFTALFCMLVVFAVLVVLWAIVRVFSVIIRFMENRKNPTVLNKNPND